MDEKTQWNIFVQEFKIFRIGRIFNNQNDPAGSTTAPDANSTNDMSEGFRNWNIGESTISIGSVEINSQRNRQSPKI